MSDEGGQVKRRPGRPVGSDGALTEKVTFQVTPLMLRRMDWAAERAGVDRSTWLRRLIETECAKGEGTP